MSGLKTVRVLIIKGFLLTAGIAASVSGKSIKITSPSPWYTVRGESVVVKGVIDTSTELNTTLYLYGVSSSGRNLLAKKGVDNKRVDFEVEFSEKSISDYTGEKYLNVEWRNDADTGGVFPFCVANTSKQSEETKEALYKKGGPDPEKIDPKEISGFSLFWDNRNLYFVCTQEMTEKSEIIFSIDGENGKKGFLGYADRFAEFDSEKESADMFYFKREKTRKGVDYKRLLWSENDLTYTLKNGILVITMPFYEVVIKPEPGRRTGFAVFRGYKKGDSLFPEKASIFSPVTWGNMILKKK